jgi:CRP/FNR family transcriptional regulator
MTSDVLDILKRCALFSGLEKADLQALARIAMVRNYKKAGMIMLEGEHATGFYVVASGKVKVFKLSPEGKEQILNIAAPGETFAEAAVFSGTDYPASASALSPATVLYFPKIGFERLIKKHPHLALNMLARMSILLRTLNRLVEELSLKEVSARVAKYLLDRAVQSGEAGTQRVEVHLEISKHQLAARLGTISETLSRTLTKLKTAGIIQVHRNSIVILDKERLELVAAGSRI